MPVDWSDPATVEYTKSAWAKGTSGTRIANYLGCSRNAVQGAINRWGLARRKAPKPRPIRAKPRHPFTPKFEPPPQVTEALPTISADDLAIPRSELKTLFQLEPGDCRFPIDQPEGGVLFCPAEALIDYPYCPAHCRRAYSAHTFNPRAYIPQRTGR